MWWWPGAWGWCDEWWVCVVGVVCAAVSACGGRRGGGGRGSGAMTGELALPALRARQNLREEITQPRRASVIPGELRPGVVYSAPSLAAQFGVSATPVREAMLDLAGEGLVDVVRHQGV